MKQLPTSRNAIRKAALFLLCIPLACDPSAESRPDPFRARQSADQESRVYIENPYAVARTRQLKGQLHCHTTNSDGKHTPQSMVQAYRRSGYNFVAITDHSYLTTPSHNRDGFAWKDPSDEDFLLIRGVEETKRGGHVLSLDASSSVLEGVWPRSMTLQEILDAVVGQPSQPLAIIAHPDAHWPIGYHQDDPDNPDDDPENDPAFNLANTSGYVAIEVANGGTGPSTMSWDRLLADNSGATERGESRRRIWGVGVDDFHGIIGSWAGLDEAWVNVFADSLTVDSVKESLRTGNFYTSMGPELQFSVQEPYIRVQTTEPSSFKWIGHAGNELQVTESVAVDAYRVKGDEGYVRVEVTSPTGGKALSNPFYVGKDTSACHPNEDATPAEVIYGFFDSDNMVDKLSIYQKSLCWDVTSNGTNAVWLQGWGGGNRTLVADFSGDGLDDILLIYWHRGLNVWRWHLAVSTGNGFTARPDVVRGWGLVQDIFIGKFDDDLKDDVLVVYYDQTLETWRWHLALATGDHFEQHPDVHRGTGLGFGACVQPDGENGDQIVVTWSPQNICLRFDKTTGKLSATKCDTACHRN